MINNENRYQGLSFENRIAKLAGLEVTPGSGCGLLFKGDFRDDTWHIEAKSTRNNTLRIKRSWWEKALKQAQQTHKKYTALIVGWSQIPTNYKGLHSIFVLVADNTEPLTNEFAKQKTFMGSGAFPLGPEEGELLCEAIMNKKDPHIIVSDAPKKIGCRLRVLTIPQFLDYRKKLDETISN